MENVEIIDEFVDLISSGNLTKYFRQMIRGKTADLFTRPHLERWCAMRDALRKTESPPKQMIFNLAKTCQQ